MAKLSRIQRIKLRAIVFASNLTPAGVVAILLAGITVGLALAFGAR